MCSQAKEQKCDKRRGSVKAKDTVSRFPGAKYHAARTLRTSLSCALRRRQNDKVFDEHHPVIQSKSSNGTSGHRERCICQLSSPLKSRSLHFLPPRRRAAARFQKKDFLVLITHPYDYSQWYWDAAEAESRLRCGCGQTGCKRHIY